MTTSETTDFAENRIIGLDLFRAIAIMCVLFAHGGGILLKGSRYPVSGIMYLGIIGVEFFFILSGFLIGTIILKTFKDGITWRKGGTFLVRRWFRTIPNYLLFFCINLAFVLFHGGTSLSGKQISKTLLTYFTFTQNFFFYEGYTAFFPESWSLAIEEWFYLLMIILTGIIAPFLKRNGEKSILLACVVLVVVPLLLRFHYISNHSITFNQATRTTVLHLDSIIWGVMLSLIYTRYPIFIRTFRKIFALIGIFLFTFCSELLCRGFTDDSLDNSYFARIILNPLISISITLLLPYCKYLRINQGVIKSCILYTSLYSYSLYLSNLLVLRILIEYFPVSAYLQFLLFFIFSFVVSHITYTYFEVPTTKIREKFNK